MKFHLTFIVSLAVLCVISSVTADSDAAAGKSDSGEAKPRHLGGLLAAGLGGGLFGNPYGYPHYPFGGYGDFGYNPYHQHRPFYGGLNYPPYPHGFGGGYYGGIYG